MMMPITAPPIRPDVDTVRARYPSSATIALTPMAQGRYLATAWREASAASTAIRLVSQSTAAATSGTEMLSSRRTGSVSTSAAAAAAAIGAVSENRSGGAGVSAGRVQPARPTPASAPNTENAVVPAMVFSAFHGSLFAG